MSLIQLTENISYLPATTKPVFSCDVVFIKTDKATWIFDVGAGKAALDEINKIEGPKNVVISHFHPDHIFNLKGVKYDNLYVSEYTKKYTFSGTVVKEEHIFKETPEIRIVPLPSSHAKGCLCLICGDYAFMGDGTFCKIKFKNHTYNTQLLYQMIEVMKSLNVKYYCLSHERNFVQERGAVLSLYEQIYSRRKPDSPIINVEDFFDEEGNARD